MATTLETLSDDSFAAICDVLQASDLLRLHLSGCKSLLSKLSRCVHSFLHHPVAKRRYEWPSFISNFPNLLYVDIRLPEVISSPEFESFSEPFFYGIDMSMIPSSIRTIRFEFDNAIFALLDIPFNEGNYSLNGAHMKPLQSMYPLLTSLQITMWKEYDVDGWQPSILSPFFALPLLTTLHLPFPFQCHFLPNMNVNHSITDLSLDLVLSQDPKDIILPSSLISLKIINLPPSFPISRLPRGIISLQIEYNYLAIRSPEDELDDWPPNLIELILQLSSTNVKEGCFTRLPRSLQYFTIGANTISSSSWTELPPNMKRLEVFCPNPNFTPEAIAKLPPSLTRTKMDLRRSELWKSFPRNASNGGLWVEVEENSIDKLFDLPPSQSFLNFKTKTLPSSLPLSSHFTNLTHLAMTSSSAELNRNFFQSISSLLQLQELGIISAILKDTSLLDLLVVSLKVLHVRCDGGKLNFSSSWAQTLRKLTISDLGMNLTRIPTSEERMQNPPKVHSSLESLELLESAKKRSVGFEIDGNESENDVIHLPKTLTAINSTACGSFQFPTNRQFWPPMLTNLTTCSVSCALPMSSWGELPLSLTYFMTTIEMWTTEMQLENALHALPHGLNEIHIQVPHNGHIPKDISTHRGILDIVKSRSHLLQLSFNGYSCFPEEYPPDDILLSTSQGTQMARTSQQESLGEDTQPNDKKRPREE
jgi:hypothetical protein